MHGATKWVPTESSRCVASYDKYIVHQNSWAKWAKWLTRAWPGSQPNAIDRGGAYNAPPPQANSQTNDRSETGEAALKRSRRDGSKALLIFFKRSRARSRSGQTSKLSVSAFWLSETANLIQKAPNSAETLSKVRRRYCLSVNAILSTGKGQGQVTKGYYIHKSHCGHVIHVFYGQFWP